MTLIILDVILYEYLFSLSFLLSSTYSLWNHVDNIELIINNYIPNLYEYMNMLDNVVEDGLNR